MMRRMIEVRYIAHTGECASELFDGDTNEVVMMGERESMIAVIDDEKNIILGVPVNRLDSIRTFKEE